MRSSHFEIFPAKGSPLVPGRKAISVFQMMMFAIVLAIPLTIQSDARADFRMCNDTKSLVGIALGYRQNNEWVTEGWWQIPSDTCSSLIEGNLPSRFFYVYAEDADHGGQWRGDIFMCTDDREFRIVGIKECFTRGFQKTGFFEVDTGDKESWMVRLTESGQTGSSK